MTLDETLTRPLLLEKELGYYLARLDDMRGSASLSAPMEPGHTRNTEKSSPVERGILKLEHMEERIEEQKKQLAEARAAVDRIIRLLPPEERGVMTLRHLSYASWEEIASAMDGMGRTSMFRLYASAHEHAEEIFNYSLVNVLKL